MLDLPVQVKNAFRSDSCYKQMKITVGGGIVFENPTIYEESFELKESLLDGTNIGFVGCIASELTVTVRATSISMRETDYNGRSISVQIRVELGKNTYSEWVPLFFGYIDSGELNNDRSALKLVAYDMFYTLDSINCWNWYRRAFSNGAQTLEDLIVSLLDFVELQTGYEIELEPNTPIILHDVKVKKRLKNKKMTALDFIKSYCQLSGACGVISRTGQLKFVYLSGSSTVVAETYPSATTFPGTTTFPGESQQAGGYEKLQYYRSASSKDVVVRPFAQGMTIRQNADDNGVTLSQPVPEDVDWSDDSHDTYTSDETDVDINLGKYIVENNGLVKKLSKKKREAIISRVLSQTQVNNNQNYTLKSYNVTCNGLPFVELGDSIAIKKPVGSTDPQANYMICNRTLTGIQAMKDNYKFDLPETIENYGVKDTLDNEADSIDEDQVSDIATQAASDYTYDKATIDAKMADLSGLDILVVVSFSQDGVLNTTTHTVTTGVNNGV